MSTAGRRNLEQVAILVLATIMTLAAAYVIWMSAMNIVSLASHGLSFNVSNKTASSDCNVSELLSHGGPVFELPAIIICSLSVGRQNALMFADQCIYKY
jgi:hypothetical protein